MTPADIARVARSLTMTQRRALATICDEPGNTRWGWGSSCTNPTASALERKGLVKVEFDRSKGCAGFPWSRWVALPLGLSVREFLREQGR